MPTHIKDSTHHAFNRIKTLHTRQQQETSISTGFKSFDTILGNVHNGDLILLAGFPNSYKTTLALQVLIHNCLIEKKSALFANPVLSDLQIANRILALTAEIHMEKLLGGTIEKDEWPNLARIMGILADSKLIISDKTDWTGATDEYLDKIREVVAKNQIELLFIDSIPTTEKERGIETVQSLKEMAIYHEIPIILTMDIPVLSNDVTIPCHSHLKTFGDIESHANALCFAYKETLLAPQEKESEKINALILSNYGRKCRLLVNEETGKLTEN